MPAPQIATGTCSGRKDVPTPAGYKPVLSYQVATDYKALLTDGAQVVRLRKRVHDRTGVALEAGGLR